MSIRRINEHIELLRNLASNSTMKHRHACAIIKNDKLFSVGVNKYLNIKQCKISLHSEIDAMASCKNLKGKDILIIRYSSDNKLRMSKPCVNCLKQIKKNGIKKVYYSNDDGTFTITTPDKITPDHFCSMAVHRNNIRNGIVQTKTPPSNKETDLYLLRRRRSR